MSSNYAQSINSKFIWKDKGTRIAKTMFKMNKVGGIMVPNYKTYYEIIIIRTVVMEKGHT